jgi:hypothetical protein
MMADLQGLQGYYAHINDVRQYIREHIDEPLSREVLAAVLVSPCPTFIASSQPV